MGKSLGLMKNSRRHHYVWRRYLRTWAVNEQIACYSDSKFFTTNLMNVAQEKGFNDLRPLNEIELYVFNQLFESCIPKAHIKMLEYWPEFFKFFHTLYSYSDIGELNRYLQTVEEDLHTAIEQGGEKYLERLLNDDCSFYDDLEDRFRFNSYLTLQYSRTAGFKNKICGNNNMQTHGANMENIWQILKFPCSMSFAINLSVFDDVFRPVIATNPTHHELITGDQPVVNSYGNPTQLEVYYPLSPQKAFFLTDKEVPKRIMAPEDVIQCNKIIARASMKQIYAKQMNYLEDFVALYKGDA